MKHCTYLVLECFVLLPSNKLQHKSLFIVSEMEEYSRSENIPFIIQLRAFAFHVKIYDLMRVERRNSQILFLALFVFDLEKNNVEWFRASYNY